MSLIKQLTSRPTLQAITAWLGALYIGLIRATTRWRIEQPAETGQLVAAGEPVIGCLWHGRMLLLDRIKPKDRKVHVLISGHRDGLLISKGMAHRGFDTVTGSSRRGGAGALKAMTRLLQAGAIILITPDGPRGPRMRAKLGAIKAAQLSGAALVALGCATTRCRFLGSWDRFCVPFPFARGVILYSEPFRVPRDANEAQLEAHRLMLEGELNRLTAEAETRCGLAPIEPAPQDHKDRSQGHAHA